MKGPKSLEDSILGYILLDPERLKTVELTKSFFKHRHQKIVFQELEKGHTEADLITQTLLSAGIENAATYIGNLLVDPLTTKDGGLQDIIDYVRTKRLNLEATTLINKGAGEGYYDHEKIRKIYGSIDRLGAKKHKVEAETADTIAKSVLPPIDRLVEPFVERNGLTLIGGMKGVGKSLFALSLGLHAASGLDGFLKSKVPAPLRVLLIQQEVGKTALQDRLMKIRMETKFSGAENFYIHTTTGLPLKLTHKQDFMSILIMIEDIRPDLLILDPLSSFNPVAENAYQSMGPIVDKFIELKTKYNMGLVIVHHFSSKQDESIPISLAGLFRGHSSLADSADVLIGLHRLPSQQKNQPLPLPYDNYCVLETQLRNFRAPPRIPIERNFDGLLFHQSDIWQHIGRKIVPGKIREILHEAGGKMHQKELYERLQEYASHSIAFKAIQEAIKNKDIVFHKLPGKGGPVELSLPKEIGPNE